MNSALLKSILAPIHRRAFDVKFALVARSWSAAVGPVPKASRVIVSGFFNEVLGIGEAGRLTLEALRRTGVEVVEDDLRPLHRGLLTRQPVALPQAPVWLIHANPPEARIALIRHRYEDWISTKRIGYWVWESSIAPCDWAATARWFHEIWTPSTSSKRALAEAFRLSGNADEIGKLRVLPHPVLPSRVRPGTAGPIRALSLFDPRSDFDRKNPSGAVSAWMKAFPKPQDAELVIKTLPEADNYPQMKALRMSIKHRKDIIILCEALNTTKVSELIAGCHVFISLHRAEGYGLPIAEAMGHGRTVIATGWSGNMQFMSEENSLPVPYRLVPANRQYNGPRASWAEPDIEVAAELLRRAVADEALRTRLGNQARSDIARIADNWSATF